MARWVEEQKKFLESWLARSHTVIGNPLPPITEVRNYTQFLSNADLFMERFEQHRPRCTYYRAEQVKNRYSWEQSEDFRWDGTSIDRQNLIIRLLKVESSEKQKQHILVLPRTNTRHSFIDEHYSDHEYKGLYLREPRDGHPLHHFFMLHR